MLFRSGVVARNWGVEPHLAITPAAQSTSRCTGAWKGDEDLATPLHAVEPRHRAHASHETAREAAKQATEDRRSCLPEESGGIARGAEAMGFGAGEGCSCSGGGVGPVDARVRRARRDRAAAIRAVGKAAAEGPGGARRWIRGGEVRGESGLDGASSGPRSEAFAYALGDTRLSRDPRHGAEAYP